MYGIVHLIYNQLTSWNLWNWQVVELWKHVSSLLL